jgi:hypothetical protein
VKWIQIADVGYARPGREGSQSVRGDFFFFTLRSLGDRFVIAWRSLCYRLEIAL